VEFGAKELYGLMLIEEKYHSIYVAKSDIIDLGLTETL